MKQRGLGGFTLIEVLLATAIFAVISIASFSILDGVLRTKEGAEQKQNRLNEIQRAWLIIERDLLQIVRRSVRVEGEAPQTGFFYVDNGDLMLSEQAIAFVRGGWSNPNLILPRSDMQPIAYRIQENTLERMHFNFVDPVIGEEPIIRPLIKDVTDFKVQFFVDKKWRESLIENQWPEAIALIIDTEDLGELTRKFLIIAEPFNNDSNATTGTENGQAVIDGPQRAAQ
ncbi:type II secretion system minor pseudopilin GspJ [Thalassotalea hakodatensis]|uniref:type II secretion system minor pseudopilin GspJ n=1 Tax=Thalassotalea hakodatensis TaxID=3030492 RepID=UPI0025722297|nr:type II secretion system minor pseudopilin GspJ [Thalassotalea hakodatensis]